MTLDRTAQELAALIQQAQTVQPSTAPSGGRAGQTISLRVDGRALQARCLVSIPPGPVVAVLTAAGWACMPVAATRLVNVRPVEFRQRRGGALPASYAIKILAAKILSASEIGFFVAGDHPPHLAYVVDFSTFNDYPSGIVFPLPIGTNELARIIFYAQLQSFGQKEYEYTFSVESRIFRDLVLNGAFTLLLSESVFFTEGVAYDVPDTIEYVDGGGGLSGPFQFIPNGYGLFYGYNFSNAIAAAWDYLQGDNVSTAEDGDFVLFSQRKVLSPDQLGQIIPVNSDKSLSLAGLDDEGNEYPVVTPQDFSLGPNERKGYTWDGSRFLTAASELGNRAVTVRDHVIGRSGGNLVVGEPRLTTVQVKHPFPIDEGYVIVTTSASLTQ